MDKELKEWLSKNGIKDRYDTIDQLRKFKTKTGYVLNNDDALIGIAITGHPAIIRIEIDSKFQQLEYIIISDNPELNVFKISTELNNLTHLDISNNALTELSIPSEGFPKLKYFDASNNNFALGRRFTGNYPELKYLNLSNCGLEMHFFNIKLPKIEYLYLSKNKIKEQNDGEGTIFPDMPDIKEIDLSKNMISEPKIQFSYPKLERLDLRNNPIANIENLKNIFNNSYQFCFYISPSEVLKNAGITFEENDDSYALFYNYYKSQYEKKVQIPIKVLMLGNHASGKSHLRTILNHGFEPKVIPELKKIKTTHGLERKDYFIDNNNQAKSPSNIQKSSDAILYDFGGQDFYHGLYTLFMDNSCIYCLVWNPDKNSKKFVKENRDTTTDREQFEVLNHPIKFWLHQIKYIESKYSSDSWVDEGQQQSEEENLKNVNKVDEFEEAKSEDLKQEDESKINKKIDKANENKRAFLIQSFLDLGRRFTNISDIEQSKFSIIDSFGLMLNPIEDSHFNKYKAHFDFFKFCLDKQIEEKNQTIPVSHLALIDHLMKRIDDTISLVEVESIIKNEPEFNEFREKEFSIEGVLRSAHNSGFLLFYHNNSKINNMVWLRPDKIVADFKKVFSDKYFNKDRIEKGDIDELIRSKKITEKTIELYQAMNLIFSHDPGGEGISEYIIPNYLPYMKDSADYELLDIVNENALLKIRFEHFIPFGMMSQMIVYFGNRPGTKRFWRDGIIFSLKKGQESKESGNISSSDTKMNFEYKVSVKLDLIKNEFIFHAVPLREDKLIELYEIQKLRQYFFAVILKTYHNQSLNEFTFFNAQNKYQIKKLYDITRNDYELIEGISIGKIPEDMYINLDKRGNYLSVRDLNNFEKISGKYVLVSSIFKDPDKKSSQEKNVSPTLKKPQKNEGKSANEITKESGKEIVLRDFEIFSKYILGKTIDIVISYAREDKAEFERLLDHLRPMENSGKIKVFYDLLMKTGIDFNPELKARFENADVIISLVSPNWAKSSFIMKNELPIAIRRANENGNEKVFWHIPFLILPTNYKEVVAYDDKGNSLNFKNCNLLMDLEKARPKAASQYRHDEKDPYLLVAKLIAEIVEQVNTTNETD